MVKYVYNVDSMYTEIVDKDNYKPCVHVKQRSKIHVFVISQLSFIGAYILHEQLQ